MKNFNFVCMFLIKFRLGDLLANMAFENGFKVFKRMLKVVIVTLSANCKHWTFSFLSFWKGTFPASSWKKSRKTGESKRKLHILWPLFCPLSEPRGSPFTVGTTVHRVGNKWCHLAVRKVRQKCRTFKRTFLLLTLFGTAPFTAQSVTI